VAVAPTLRSIEGICNVTAPSILFWDCRPLCASHRTRAELESLCDIVLIHLVVELSTRGKVSGERIAALLAGPLRVTRKEMRAYRQATSDSLTPAESTLSVGGFQIFCSPIDWRKRGEQAYCARCKKRVKVGRFRRWFGKPIAPDYAPIVFEQYGLTFYLVAGCDCFICPAIPHAHFLPSDGLQGG
jgi:hypothetical protein